VRSLGNAPGWPILGRFRVQNKAAIPMAFRIGATHLFIIIISPSTPTATGAFPASITMWTFIG
jgi:hypothetical protein